MSTATAAKAPGTVHVLGAGPCDPELLTLKAVNALAREVREAGIASPAVLVIGEVARTAAGNRAALPPRVARRPG